MTGYSHEERELKWEEWKEMYGKCIRAMIMSFIYVTEPT